MEQELLKATELKGKKLNNNEKYLVEKYWNNSEYELKFYPKNESIGYHKKD